jgi:hypothetical protein
MHAANFVVFSLSVVFAVSDNIGAAAIAGIFSVINTFLILASQRQHRKTREDLHARRLVVVKFGDGDEETTVITPEERRALEGMRKRDD